MSPTIHHKYKYFHSTVQRAKNRRQKFHFCRLPFDVTSSLISLKTLKRSLLGTCTIIWCKLPRYAPQLCAPVVQIDPGACSWSKNSRVYHP